MRKSGLKSILPEWDMKYIELSFLHKFIFIANILIKKNKKFLVSNKEIL